MAFSFTLQGKLTVAAVVVAAMIFVGTAVGQWGFSFGVEAEQRAFETTLPAVDASWALLEQIHALEASQSPQREAAWRPVDEALARARAFPREGREADAWNAVEPALRAWRDASADERTARGLHASAVVRELLDAHRAQSQQSHAAFTRRVSSVRMLVLGSGAMGIIIVVVLGVLSARRISRALDAAVIVINEGTHQVEATSVALAADSQALAAGFTQQAHALERTSSAMTQLTAMTHQTAGNAGRARALADDASAQAQQADRSMHSLAASMAEIASTGSSIGKITTSIDEIAFQTTLLALNAAVEAARAGDAGKGFAVVANEVQALAGRAGAAAREIAALVDGSKQRIASGTTLVAQTNAAFGRVVASVTEVAGLISQISTASAEQARGIDDVGGAVNDMDGVTQQNGRSATHVAEAVERLHEQSSALSAAVVDVHTLVAGESADA